MTDRERLEEATALLVDAGDDMPARRVQWYRDRAAFLASRAPAQPAAPTPWRVGARVPEHIYDGDGNPLVTMPSAGLSARVVAAVNAQPAAPTPHPMAGSELNRYDEPAASTPRDGERGPDWGGLQPAEPTSEQVDQLRAQLAAALSGGADAAAQRDTALGLCKERERELAEVSAEKDDLQGEIVSERELCSEALRNQGRLRNERDTTRAELARSEARVKALEEDNERALKLCESLQRGFARG